MTERELARDLKSLTDEQLEPLVVGIMLFPDESVRRLIAREANQRAAVRRREGVA